MVQRRAEISDSILILPVDPRTSELSRRDEGTCAVDLHGLPDGVLFLITSDIWNWISFLDCSNNWGA